LLVDSGTKHAWLKKKENRPKVKIIIYGSSSSIMSSAVISLQIEQNHHSEKNAQGVFETENHQDANSWRIHFAGTRS
jgi:hypothetical protein